MSRKPIDKQQPSECRQAIWDWIRKYATQQLPDSAPFFTLNDVAKHILLDINSIRDYLIGLSNAGYLVATKGTGRMALTLYTFARDAGHEAPRVRKNGAPVTQGTGRRQMWNAMAVLKEFSARDLAFNASTEQHHVADSEAVTYCGALCAAGYLVARPGQRYSLINTMWTGPQPPQIQRTKQVYDPNLKRVVWSRVEGGAE
ncbi:MAG: hypothetical protein HY888_08455 [Deltaproteobacteria bacterium]|nr:hypothetical protein [Deltaproteobacteria bacterium]